MFRTMTSSSAWSKLSDASCLTTKLTQPRGQRHIRGVTFNRLGCSALLGSVFISMTDNDRIIKAFRHALEGGKVVGKLRSNNRMYDVELFMPPIPGEVNYPLVKLRKPFGAHRLHEVDFILLPNSASEPADQGSNAPQY